MNIYPFVPYQCKLSRIVLIALAVASLGLFQGVYGANPAGGEKRPLIPQALFKLLGQYRMPNQEELEEWIVNADDEGVKRVALDMLIRNTPRKIDLVSILKRIVDKEDTSFRYSVLAALANIGEPADSAVAALLTNHDFGVRHYTYVFLNNIEDEERLTSLIPLVEAAHADAPKPYNEQAGVLLDQLRVKAGAEGAGGGRGQPSN